MSEEKQDKKPDVVKVHTTQVKEFSFKKLAVGWLIVIGIITGVSVLVDYLVYQ